MSAAMILPFCQTRKTFLPLFLGANKGKNMAWFVLTCIIEIKESTMEEGVTIVNHSVKEERGLKLRAPKICWDNNEIFEIKGSMPSSMVTTSSASIYGSK